MSLYNIISGSSINVDKKLLFKIFEDENCYFSFLRENNTWGSCSLINISLSENITLNDILSYQSNINVWATENLFTDRNIGAFLDNESNSIVKIYKTDGNTPDFDITLDSTNSYLINYYAINHHSLSNVNLELQYLNNNWCVIKGLPSDFNEYINNSDGSKFYIVTNQPNNQYLTHPVIGSKMLKINNKTIKKSTLNESVKLVLSSPKNLEHVNRFDISKIYNLTKCTSILGEVVVKGLTNRSFTDNTTLNEQDFTDFVNYELDYIQYVNNNLEYSENTGYYFYLVNYNNEKVSPDLFLQKNESTNSIFNYDNEGNKYLLFKTKETIDGKNDSIFIKITYETSPLSLAIFNESLPYSNMLINTSNSVSDANPPALDIMYLKNKYIDSSLFDIKNYIKLKKNYLDVNGYSSKISFVKEIRNEAELNKYTNQFGFTLLDSDPNHIQTLYITLPTQIIRTGNIRPKPNGIPYSSTDRRLYLWVNNFNIGDNIKFKVNPSDNNYYPTNSYLTVTSIDYDEGYIGFNTNLGIGGITPSISNNSNTSQVISDYTNILNSTKFAVTNDIKSAIKFEMDSIMVDVEIPSSSTNEVYNGIYRQIAISFLPKYYDQSNATMNICSDIFYTDSNNISLFDYANHVYDPGTILYISNKFPVYRQYLTGTEVFKLII